MPLSGLPCDGTYKIVPVVRSDAPTSINSAHLPVSLVVHLGLPDKSWEVTEKGDGVYQLSHRSSFKYTGGNQAVIASSAVEDNLLWVLGPAQSSDHCFGLTIAPKEAGECEKGWTVADESNPKSEIILEKITYLPPLIYPPFVEKATQLFRFEKVDE